MNDSVVAALGPQTENVAGEGHLGARLEGSQEDAPRPVAHAREKVGGDESPRRAAGSDVAGGMRRRRHVQELGRDARLELELRRYRESARCDVPAGAQCAERGGLVAPFEEVNEVDAMTAPGAGQELDEGVETERGAGHHCSRL